MTVQQIELLLELVNERLGRCVYGFEIDEWLKVHAILLDMLMQIEREGCGAKM